MKFFPVLALFCLCTTAGLSAAEPLPLASQYWREPSFLKAFAGSYEIEARIEPTVNTEERDLLIQVQNLMATEKRTEALALIKGSSLTASSAALQFNQGNLQFEEGKIEDAIKSYQAAIMQYPSFRRAHRNLAMAIMRKETVKEALPPLLEAIRLGDQEGVTYGLLGYCRLEEQQWASALQAYRMALLVEPESVDWKTGLAQCLQHLDQSEEAIALLDEVIAARPEQASYGMLQASLLMSMDRNDQAIAALELPRRLNTLDAEGLMLLAELQLRAKRESLAVPLIAEAFARQPQPTPGRIIAALRSSVNLEAWKLGRELETRALAATTDKDVAYRNSLKREQARIDIGSGEAVDKGVKTLRDLIAAKPDDGSSLLVLGRHLARSGDREEAEMLLERATLDDENAFDAWFELARVRVDQKRFQVAVEALDKAIALRESEELTQYRDALASLVDATK